MFRSPLSTASPLLVGLLLSGTAFAQEPSEEAQPVEAEEAATAEAEEEAPAASEEEAPEAAPAESEAPSEEVAPAPEPEATPAEEPEAEAAEEPAEEEAEAPQEEPVVEEASPSLLPLKVGTHTFSRFEVREGYDTLGVSRTRFQEGDQTVFRTRLTIESAPLQLTEGIEGSVYVAPQASGLWGTQGIGGTIGEANLGIYEGYFKLKGEMLQAKVGRFAMNYGDALMIGNLDWHQSGRAFDGAHLSLTPGKVVIDAFLTQTGEGYPLVNEPLFGGDSYFWGFYGQFGKAIAEGMALDAYVLGKTAAATDVDDGTGAGTIHKDGATFVTIGARAKQKIGMFDYRVEGGIQTGKTVGAATANTGKFAYNIDGELGLTFVPGTRLSVGGAIASGDASSTTDTNEAWDELYPTTHKWFGLMDVIGFRTNVESLNLKFGTKFTKSTIFKIHGHVFGRNKDGGLGRSDNAKLAGYEVDTILVQKIGKFAYTKGIYGIFLPNEDHYGSASAAHYGELSAGLKF